MGPRNQIRPLSQRLGGRFDSALRFRIRAWKHCGSKRARIRKWINEMGRTTDTFGIHPVRTADRQKVLVSGAYRSHGDP